VSLAGATRAHSSQQAAFSIQKFFHNRLHQLLVNLILKREKPETSEPRNPKTKMGKFKPKNKTCEVSGEKT